MSMLETYQTIARLLGFGAVIHAFEFLVLGPRIVSVWRWSDLERELGRFFRPLLSGPGFFLLNLLRFAVGAATILQPHPVAVWILCALHLLTLIRWLGTFNGGSDYMTLLALWTCALGFTKPEALGGACLYYLAFQLCLSYFRAGWIKFKNADWRDGRAFRAFLNSPVYEANPAVSVLVNQAALARWLARLVILFEMTFPLSVLHPELALVYMALGFVFHLGNAYVFGLNRFVWAWLAAYPALVYVSVRLSL